MEAQLIAASTLLFRHLFSLSPLTLHRPSPHPSLSLSLSLSLVLARSRLSSPPDSVLSPICRAIPPVATNYDSLIAACAPMAKFIDSREFYDTTTTIGVYLPLMREPRVDFCRVFDATSRVSHRTNIHTLTHIYIRSHAHARTRTVVEFYRDFSTSTNRPSR